jgi:hypothetical protein
MSTASAAAVIVAIAVNVVHHDAVNALLPVLTIREHDHYVSDIHFQNHFKRESRKKRTKSDWIFHVLNFWSCCSATHSLPNLTINKQSCRLYLGKKKMAQ